MHSLPLDYSITNLTRRPLRSVLSVVACALATSLVLGALAFTGALDRSFSALGRDDVAVVMGKSSENDSLRSEIDPSVAAEITAGVRGVRSDRGRPLVSPEITMGVDVRVTARGEARPALMRGVTDAAFALHSEVTLIDGRPPEQNEAIVGELAAQRLGVTSESLEIGKNIDLDGHPLAIVGHFAAPGSVLDAEIWAPLESLMAATRRKSISCVFVGLESADAFGNVDLFCRRRLDLELSALRTSAFYGSLARYFSPVRRLSMLMAVLIAIATFITGATTLSTIVRERRVEIATLRAIGFHGGAIVRAILLEALFYGAAGCLLGGLVARFLLTGTAVPIAMGAVRLDLDSRSLVLGFLFTLTLCQIAALPALIATLSKPVAIQLRQD